MAGDGHYGVGRLASPRHALGQTGIERTLHFAHLTDPQSLMEAATVIRSTGLILHAKLDAPSKTLALRGDAEQIALAEWLLSRLDQPPTAKQPPIQKYQVKGSAEGEVRVLFPRGAHTVQSMQELATVVRSITEIRQGFTFSPLKAAILRGTADQLAIAEWVYNQLDGQPSDSEFRQAGSADDVVRVFFLTPAKTLVELQQNANVIRKTAMIRRMFLYNPGPALAARGTPEQLAVVEQMLKDAQLMRP
jgi:hypothetical protein